MDWDWYASRSGEQLAEALSSRQVSATELWEHFRHGARALEQEGPQLHSVLETNPDGSRLAAEADARREHGARRGTLDGLPVLVKDNIDTADAMSTTAGSPALLTSSPGLDAPVVSRLRTAGAILAGKANMSEWANFRSVYSTSGWSARGGTVRNPYALDRSAGGSSSGSAAAVSAGLVPYALGSETDGSILCPASFTGIVGLKPTVGLLSQDGVIPISHGQDTLGPFARTVRDVAVLFDVLADGDGRYLAHCRPDSARGLRVGVPRLDYWGAHPKVETLFIDTVSRLAAAGAEIVDGLVLPGLEELAGSDDELTRLLYDLKWDLTAYLESRPGDGPRSLAELIEFNRSNAQTELAHFGQDLFLRADEKGPRDEPEYRAAVETAVQRGGAGGIDRALADGRVDILAAPAYDPPCKIDLVNGDGPTHHRRASIVQAAAVAGYPGITVPMGLIDGLPVGIVFVGSAGSEGVLIRAAHAVETVAEFSARPGFRPAAPG